MTSTNQPTPDDSTHTVFEQLLAPIDEFIREQDAALPCHHNQKLGYYAFFRLLIYFFVAEGKSFRLFIEVKLNNGLLPGVLNLQHVAYTTVNEAFERFSVGLFRDAFQHVVQNVPFKHIPELATLGRLYCIDGSVFPVVSSMLWAKYTATHQALKLHLCFELNRMIATEFLVSAANYSERLALLKMAQAGVTYIADRGYMSFAVCHQLLEVGAHFVFRVKTNLLYSVTETLPLDLPPAVQALFGQVSDELIRYTNDKFGHVYRLVSFSVGSEIFHILTDRRDLTTYQVIMLYAYRWQIELLFRFLKRTMNGIHLIKQDKRGVTIQFYAMLTAALLQLRLKQVAADLGDDADSDAGSLDSSSGGDTAKTCGQPDTEKSVGQKYEFVETIGKNLCKYWKIGIHWLTALRSLLAEHFDRRAVEILNSS